MELYIKVIMYSLPWFLWLSQSELVLCNMMFTSLTQMRHLAEKEDVIKNIFQQYINSGNHVGHELSLLKI